MSTAKTTDTRPILRLGLRISLAAAILLALLGWIVGDSWSMQGYESDEVARSAILGLPHDGMTVEQGVDAPFETLERIELAMAPTGEATGGTMTVQVRRAGQLLDEQTVSLAGLEDDGTLNLRWPDGLDVGGKDSPVTLCLVFREQEGLALPALWGGDSVDAGRFTVDATGLDRLSVDGESRRARVCMTVHGHSASAIMRWYWPLSAAAVLLCVLFTFRTARRARLGQGSFFLRLGTVWRRYGFLLEQLVRRDFNTKYRQSILGVVWSFLNPLMTMAVQYVVFSTLFRSSIPNFPVYLLTGIILFNYFSETVSLGLESIVLNGPLISKVYMPKYIYPLSRSLSSCINLLISLVPLLLMMLVSRVPFTKALLLVPLDIVFLFCFALGMAMILCTLNVFFRDTRFLWGVAVLLWTYATPIFYPETIIPASLRTLYHCNPMYQFIYFMRCITISGTTPAPVNYLYCILCAGLALAAGLWVFRRNQDKFVFYL